MTPPSRILLLFAALAASGRAAEAHAFLSTATPAPGSTVAVPPATVTLRFTEDVEPAFSAVTVTDSAGRTVSRGAPHIAGGNAAMLAVALGPAGPGRYTVTWHATAVDTHRTAGHFVFTVAPR